LHGKFSKPTKDISTPDALSVSALTHVMLDVSFRDAKNRSLLDIPETRDELFKTVLGAPLVMERLRAGKLHIVLF
jgi:protein CMS1